MYLLHVRDVVNSVLLIICLVQVAQSVELMAADKSMKMTHMSEGTSYVFFKSFFKWVHVDYENVLPRLGLKLPHEATFTDPNFGDNERFEHAGEFMLFWAMLTACIAKLVYFNTLFTYLRAMDIFVSLNPTFDYDESDDTVSNVYK